MRASDNQAASPTSPPGDPELKSVGRIEGRSEDIDQDALSEFKSTIRAAVDKLLRDTGLSPSGWPRALTAAEGVAGLATSEHRNSTSLIQSAESQVEPSQELGHKIAYFVQHQYGIGVSLDAAKQLATQKYQISLEVVDKCYSANAFLFYDPYDH